MSLAATYVSTTSFTVANDKTGDFNPGRSVYLNCGDDGVKYGYVASSSYADGVTTVLLNSSDSQTLTSNLTECLFSIFKLERTGGNNPLEILWLIRGQQTIACTYKDADEITLNPGVVHLNDGTSEALYRCNGFDKQLTSLSASTWYYIYAQAPTAGRVLSADQITYSTTAPTLDGAKQGYYHPTETAKRCIGFVYYDSSALLPFRLNGDLYHFDYELPHSPAASPATPSNTWTDSTAPIPLGNCTAFVRCNLVYSNANTDFWVRKNGESHNGNWVAYIDSTNGKALVHTVYVPCDSNKVFEHRFAASTTNSAWLACKGFITPSEIYSAGSGGGASETPMFSTASRGLQSIAMDWASTSSVALKPGAVHIWDTTRETIYQIPAALTLSFTGLSTNTWYAVYVQAPSGGNTISASELSYSSTMPTYSDSKMGWYDSTGAKRCVGFVWSGGSSQVAQFYIENGAVKFYSATSTTHVNPSNVWTAYTYNAPLPNCSCIVHGVGIRASADTDLYVSFDGGASSLSICHVTSYANRATWDHPIKVNGSKQVHYKWGVSTTNDCYTDLIGFHLPNGIYTGPAGGTDRAVQTGFDVSKRGIRTGLKIGYSSTTAFTVDGGIAHVNDGSNDYILETQSQLTKSVTGLSASTWYCVYIKPPATGNVVSSGDIKYWGINSVVPAFDHAKNGWYHPTDLDHRVIGFFYSNASSQIAGFVIEHNTFRLYDELTALSWSDGNINTSTTVTLNIPFGNMICLINPKANRYATNSGGVFLKDVDTGNICHYIGYISATATEISNSAIVRANASKQINFAGDSRCSGEMRFGGFVIPHGI